MGFAEWEAATAAGLDLWKWTCEDYSRLFKAKVLAWYRAHQLVEAHTEQAKADKAAQLAKRGR